MRTFNFPKLSFNKMEFGFYVESEGNIYVTASGYISNWALVKINSDGMLLCSQIRDVTMDTDFDLKLKVIGVDIL